MALRRWVAPLLVVPAVVLLTFGTVLAATPTFGTMTVPLAGHPWSLAVADLNHDRIPDVVFTEAYDKSGVAVQLGTGDGSFGKATEYDGGNPSAITTADLNGDGNPDLVGADYGVDSVSVRLGSGKGTFGAVKTFPVGTSPVAIAAADFNADGHPDVAVTDYGDASDEVSVLLGKGDGGFLPATHDPTPNKNSAQSMAAADINGDGKVDLIVGIGANGTDPGTVAVFTGAGNGAFTDVSNVPVQTSPSSIAVGDFNEDGHADLAVASESPSDVQILIGDGAGHFEKTEPISPFEKYPSDVVAADLNHDGHLDLVVAAGNTVQGPPHNDNVSVLIGNGDGMFAAPERYATGPWPRRVGVADLNNDGKPDIVAGNEGDATATVLLNGVADSGPDRTIPPVAAAPHERPVPSPSRLLRTPAPMPQTTHEATSAFGSSASSKPAHHSRVPLVIGGAGIGLGGVALVGWRFVRLR